MSYVDEFMKLRCARDVLNICNPINNASKEISESMAIVKKVRSVVLEKPMYYTMLDFCCGSHGLTGVLAAHLLPLKQVIAFDIREPRRLFHKVRRYQYIQCDIKNLPEMPFDDGTPCIWTATHACGSLSTKIISLWNGHKEKRDHLYLMPCCKGNLPIKIPQVIVEKIGKYLAWSYSLAQHAHGDLIVDDRIMSPCNAIVRANGY